jgi:PadR family transcriptional regulator PadR
VANNDQYLKDNFMIAEKIKTQLRTGVLEYCVMQILRRGEVYASDVIEELLEEDIIKVEGIIYPLLMRLKQENLVQYDWTEAQNGLPKKHYQLTDSGQNTIKALDQTWNEINKSAKRIKKKTDEQLKTVRQESHEDN